MVVRQEKWYFVNKSKIYQAWIIHKMSHFSFRFTSVWLSTLWVRIFNIITLLRIKSKWLVNDYLVVRKSGEIKRSAEKPLYKDFEFLNHVMQIALF